ncbi:MAG: ROK family protein [Gemmataceae bacterium]|nr:ROK family protein [Gemmataceae bacterium]
MYLGIEIGGTKLQLGLGPGDGTILGLWRGAVDPAAGGEGIRRQIVGALPELLAKAGAERSALKGVGVGFGGPTDDATQSVIKSHQIAGWDGFPLGNWVSELVGVPAVICNDADVAGLAEALFGAGKGLSPIFYMTIGSGIGGGLVIDGEIYRGCGRGAAEIGHLRVRQPKMSPPIRTANGSAVDPPTLEDIASGWGIGRMARRMLQLGDYPGNAAVRLAGSPDRVTAREIGMAVQEGDLFANGILWCAQTALAEAICQLVVLVCPRRVVIGGGVSLTGELFFQRLRQLVAEQTFPPFAGLTDIVPAALGEEVVVHGALASARRKLGTSPT